VSAAAANATDSASRYGLFGGSLAPLPFSGRESRWVSEVFQQQGIAAGQLTGNKATEAQVRFNVAGRRIVHLACHGLADEQWGNFFGALALAPGGSQQSGATDDGYLTLAEIYELNMQGCELAILSACNTNYGPELVGEGVWALSRGFLVAGAQRVVASNWLVDDEAAASLISVFCGSVAKDEAAGRSPDYSKALHAAKRWARQQDKWRSPYYWATFVQLGPS
jgi:CHAT domain-containing protein